MALRIHKFSLCMTAFMALTLSLPFARFSPNRIAIGETFNVFSGLPTLWNLGLIFFVLFTSGTLIFARQPKVKLAASSLTLLCLFLAIGQSGKMLLAQGSAYARVAPASGFWLLAFALAIVLADAIVRLKPPPVSRLVFLAGAVTSIGLILYSGQWDALSLMSEYSHHTTVFWREAVHHLQLALGSLLAAACVGIPLGILVHRCQWLKTGLMNTLSLIQTIPSMALFGILIGPLGWLAANSNMLHEVGIRGIGMPPAFVALFLYSLLPMVVATAAGLSHVDTNISEAASGMGMTPRQRLFSIELPLALPIILTGIRIVLVQNIGLATIAALMGGGGFGVFVFQGLGQTATDLILLGALPTVAFAFVSSVCLNVAIDLSKGVRK